MNEPQISKFIAGDGCYQYRRVELRDRWVFPVERTRCTFLKKETLYPDFMTREYRYWSTEYDEILHCRIPIYREDL